MSNYHLTKAQQHAKKARFYARLAIVFASISVACWVFVLVIKALQSTGVIQ